LLTQLRWSAAQATWNPTPGSRRITCLGKKPPGRPVRIPVAFHSRAGRYDVLCEPSQIGADRPGQIRNLNSLPHRKVRLAAHVQFPEMILAASA
jgi:hypothetical protein